MSQVCQINKIANLFTFLIVGFIDTYFLMNISTRHDIVFNVLRMSVVDYDYDVGKELTKVSSQYNSLIFAIRTVSDDVHCYT